MAKLVDAPDLGSGNSGCVGSSPIRRTKKQKPAVFSGFCINIGLDQQNTTDFLIGKEFPCFAARQKYMFLHKFDEYITTNH